MQTCIVYPDSLAQDQFPESGHTFEFANRVKIPGIREEGVEQSFSLGDVSWMTGNTMMNFNVDLALTHYVLGNIDQCIKILEGLPLESLPPTLRANIVPFFTELRTSPVDAASRVQAWERENVERLGLAETVIGAVQNR